jgi:DNA-binding PucR family transcriptional regulator
MTELDKDVIVALADNGMKISGAGRVLFMCYNTVLYHIQKIKTATGLDPRDFHDLCVLYAMVRKERKDNGT